MQAPITPLTDIINFRITNVSSGDATNGEVERVYWNEVLLWHRMQERTHCLSLEDTNWCIFVKINLQFA